MDGTARRARLARARLCLVIEALPDVATLLEAALRGGVDVVQLRDKELADAGLVGFENPKTRLVDERRDPEAIDRGAFKPRGLEDRVVKAK